MTHYDRLKRKRLGDVLVDEDLVAEDAVITALTEQQKTGRLLSDILLEDRAIDEFALARVVVEQYQAPFIDLKRYTLHKDLIEEFPAALLHNAAIVPMDRFGKQVCFACQEVPAEDIVEQLKQLAPGGAYFYVASSVEIRQALQQYAAVTEAAVPIEAVGSAGQTPALAASDLSEDTAWKELFDSANEEILQGLDEDEEPGD